MSVDLIAALGERELSVRASRDNGVWRVTVGEETALVDAEQVRPGTWSLLIGGRSWVVDVRSEGSRTWIEVDGRQLDVELESAQARRLRVALGRDAGASARGEVVRAPIAGKVVKLLVEVGDEVAAGASVAVLEAMKMENELRAERGGRVSEIGAAAGDSVETNQVLLKLDG